MKRYPLLTFICNTQTRRNLPVALTMLLVSACGGGGSSSSPVHSIANESPPALPGPVYHGLTTGAMVTPLNAGSLSEYIFESVDVTESISSSITKYLPAGTGAVSGTENGPEGGTVKFTGYITDGRNGWYTEDFHQFAYVPTGTTQTLTVDGELLVEINGNKSTLGFSDYQVDGFGLNLTYSGNAFQTTSSDSTQRTNSVNTTLNLSIVDNVNAVDNEFSDFALSTVSSWYATNGSTVSRTFSGRMYNSAIGYLNVNTTGPIEYSDDPSNLLPVGGDAIQITSQFTDTLTVAPLNAYFYAIGLSRGTAPPSSWARFKWSDFSIDTTPGTVTTDPVAVAEVDTYPGIGFPMTLDALYSHSPRGDYLNFQWKLLRAPIGSTATISGASSALATISLDVVGDYLIQLKAIDGGQVGTDTIVLSVTSMDGNTVASPASGYTAGPDQNVNIGDTVNLDARSSSALNYMYVSQGVCWSLAAPPGSNAVLSDPTSVTPTFVPDVAGYYYVSLAQFGLGGCTGTGETLNSASMVVSVGESLAFYPPVRFDASLVTSSRFENNFEVTDLNNDGLPDIVVGAPPGAADAVGDDMRVYIQTGHGNFNSPVIFPGTGNDTFAVGDLNQDGRPDIVAAGTGTLSTYLQASDGTFSLSQTASYPDSFALTQPVQIGDLDGGSPLAVGVLDSDANFYEFPVDSSGTLQPYISVDLGPNRPYDSSSLQIADVNDDGFGDLIFGNSPPVPEIYDGGSSNTFTIFSAPNSITAAAAKLYADGKHELIYAGDNFLTIEPETSSGSALTISTPLGNPQALAFANIAGSGRTDIAILHHDDSMSTNGGCACGVGFFYQQPDTSFSSEVFYPTGTYTSGPLWVGDLNGDGIPDLVYDSDGQIVIQYGYRP